MDTWAVKEIDRSIYDRIKANWDHLAKPLDGLGDFEEITCRIGAINQDESVDISRRVCIMMCSDNGIIEEGVSQSGSDITLSVARLMGKKLSSVGKMSIVAKADTYPIDVGIKDADRIEGVLNRKIAKGSRNFLKEPAMTRSECDRAIEVGMEAVRLHKEMGYKLIATGEMGIGNTTSSAACAAGLLKLTASEIAGRGAGLSDQGLARKIKVIDEAIEKYDLYKLGPKEILTSVGGYDIAGLCGVFIGGAVYGLPVVIDGFISAVAALFAERILPGVREFCIPSHMGREKGIYYILNELKLKPFINGNMALGEGTGAVMLFSMLDVALSLYHDGTNFADTDMDQYERFK